MGGKPLSPGLYRSEGGDSDPTPGEIWGICEKLNPSWLANLGLMCG